MSIERSDFDSVGEQDLQELIDGQVPEGLRIDYKLGVYGAPDADRRELLKDVSAFANSQGGHIVLGMEENAGVAIRLAGITGLDTDAEILRMEQIVRTGLEPRISGLRFKAVRLTAASNHALVIRVPRSWNPPHRVTAQGSNRFYVRHSAGVHEASVEELRTLFIQSASALEQARQFRNQRLNFIREGRGDRPLSTGGRLILHMVPVAAFSGSVRISVEEAYRQHQAFRPIGGLGFSPRFNYYGFINEAGGEENNGYTQVFRDGCLEATRAEIVNEDARLGYYIPGLELERYVFEVLHLYITGLRDLGVPPPLIVMFTLEGVQGASYAVARRAGSYGRRLPEDVLLLPECIIEDYGTEVDHHVAVRPAFDALWNAVGLAHSQYFDQEGRWVGQRQ